MRCAVPALQIKDSLTSETIFDIINVSGPNIPSLFRMMMPPAAIYLRNIWQEGGHPYDASQPVWTGPKPFTNLLANVEFLGTENPGTGEQVQHVVLDVKSLLNE